MCAWMLRDGGAGRRVAFLASLVGMTIANVVVVMSLTSAAAAAAALETLDAIRALAPLLFTLAHAAGVGTVPWLVATEAFPHYARAAAVAFLGAAHWSYALDAVMGAAMCRWKRPTSSASRSLPLHWTTPAILFARWTASFWASSWQRRSPTCMWTCSLWLW